MELSKLKALIRLVEDPDEIVFKHVRDRLLDYGSDAVPFLEQSWEEDDYGLVFQKRVENILHDIQFQASMDRLKTWLQGEEKDLIEGALCIAKWQYPGLNEKAVYQQLDAIQRDIWLEMSQKNTILEKIRLFNKVFYNIHGFRGNTENYHSPLNSFINTVLETRSGNPLSLCILYAHLAQKVDLPVFGVNLPNHFILACMDTQQINRYRQAENRYGVLFYINAFSKGSLFDEQEIKTFLANYKVAEEREYFEPCSHTQIIRRMINNLISSFQEVGNKQKVDELLQLRALLEDA